MTLKKHEKQQILKNLIETISHAADKEYQKRVWLLGLGPECEDFDDFTDVVLHENAGVLKNHINFALSKEQYETLKQFQKELKNFSQTIALPYQPPVFLDTSEWGKIMKMAKEVLAAFNYTKPKTE
ncbi:MAG: hypothetical protein P0S96_01485 [Simkaniaceae bacterium]|nr:hypothetical protein [Candidatus Sacchlamyda saccharinae]